MIYILQETKKSKRKKQHSFDVSDAKFFMYNLNQPQFINNRYFLFGGDTDEEVSEILEYFVDDFLIKTNYNGFTVYELLWSVNKPDRVRNNGGVSIKSLQNFKDKINEIFPEYIVEIKINSETFDVILSDNVNKTKLVCDYNMDILKWYGAPLTEEYVDIAENEIIYKKINKLFRKQRYYYRSKQHGK